MKRRKQKAKARGRAFTPEAARAARLEGLRKAAERKAAMMGEGSPQGGAAAFVPVALGGWGPKPDWAGDDWDVLAPTLEDIEEERKRQAALDAYEASPAGLRRARERAANVAACATFSAKLRGETPPNLGESETMPPPSQRSDDRAPALTTLTGPPDAIAPVAPVVAKPGDPEATYCPRCRAQCPPGGLAVHKANYPDCDPRLDRYSEWRKRGFDVYPEGAGRIRYQCQRCGKNASLLVKNFAEKLIEHAAQHAAK